MTSTEIQRHITTIAADITATEARLQHVPQEKRALVATGPVNEKALQKLEAEETELVTTLAKLKTRLVLFEEPLARALREESMWRVEGIKKGWGECVSRVGADTGRIRKALADLLQLIEGAHQAWGEYLTLSDEGAYLAQRFGLPRLAPPPVDRFGVKELDEFRRRAAEYLLRPASEAQEWASKAEEWRAEQSRLLQQAEREHPRPSIAVSDRSGPALAEAREELRRKVLAHFGVRDTRRQPNP